MSTPAAPASYPHHSTAELLQMNATYLREYREDPTPEKLAAVNATSIALSARNA